MAVSQIPRLIPAVSLVQLADEESLIPALTPRVLKQTAELLGVRREWLEGTSDVIYNVHYSYKNPWAFFEDVRSSKIDEFAFPLVAFTSVKRLRSNRNSTDQPIVLVLREPCAQLEDKTIYRYHIHDQFLWGYWKCRIQLKAMMRVWYKKYQAPVHIYGIDNIYLDALEKGRLVPQTFYQNSRRVDDADLEDYSLTPEESAQSKDLEEFSTVLEYIDAYKLNDVWIPKTGNPRGSGPTMRFT